MAFGRRLLGVLVIVLAIYFRSYWFLVYAVPLAAVRSVSTAVSGQLSHADDTTLKTLMQNVTTDYHQLATLMQEFVTSSEVPPETEVRLREFLAVKATRSFPRLERYLDWILRIYWFSLPILVVILVMNLLKPSESSNASETDGSSMHESASFQTSRRPSAPREKPAPRRTTNSQSQDYYTPAERTSSRRDGGDGASTSAVPRSMPQRDDYGKGWRGGGASKLPR